MQKIKLLPALALALSLATYNLRSAAPTPTFTVTPGGLYGVLGRLAFDDNVEAITATASMVYVAGRFTRIGSPVGGGVPIDASTGVAVAGFPFANAEIKAAVPDGAGGWYIGGTFDHVAGQPRSGLAHIFSNNSLDPAFLAGTVASSDYVNALALGGGILYVGGYFGQISSTSGALSTRNNLAAFDTATGNATAFDPNCDGEVFALALTATQLYAGGGFTTVNGATTRNYAAAFNLAGVVNAFDPNCDYTVYALAVSSTAVVLGGYFGNIGASARNYMGMVNGATGAVLPFDPNLNGSVYAIAVSTTAIYAGGNFTTANGGTDRNHLAAFNTGGTLTAFNAGAWGDVNALALAPGLLYVGGAFNQVTGTGGVLDQRNHLAAFNTGTGLTTSYNPDCAGGSELKCLTLTGSALFCGGDFNVVGGAVRNHMAAFDAVTGALTSFNPDCDAPVYTLALGPGLLYAGGGFGFVNVGTGNLARNCVAAFDTGTGVATAFDPNCDDTVLALAVGPSTVYVGGFFDNINNGAIFRPRMASFTLAGAATTIDYQVSGTSPQVNQIALSGSTLFVAGNFANIGGLGRLNLASLDAATGIANAAFDANVNDSVYSISVGSGRIYAGGQFTSVNTATTRNRIAGFDAITGQTFAAFNPDCDDYVNTVLYDGGTVYAGGGFFYAGATPRQYMAAFDANNGTVVPGFDPSPDNVVICLAMQGTTLHTGGAFGVVANEAAGRYAALNVPPAPTQTPSPTPQTATLVGPGEVVAYPQPAKDKVCFAFNPNDSGETMIEVYDISFRPVARFKTTGVAGIQNTSCESSAFLSQGVYLYRVKVGSFTSAFKKFWVAR